MKRLVSLILFIYGLAFTHNLSAQHRVDSLLKELAEKNKLSKEPDTNTVKLMLDISYSYSVYDAKKGLRYGEMALKMAEELHYEKGTAHAYDYLGINYWNLGNYERALQSHSVALSQYEKLRWPFAIANCLDNIGLVYLYQSQYPVALDYFLKALRVKEESGLETGIENRNLGILYSEQKEYPKALEYYRTALKISMKENSQRAVASTLGSIGNTYFLMGEFDSAVAYYRRSVVIAGKLGDLRSVATTQSNLGSIERERRHYQEALVEFQAALQRNREISNPAGIAVNFYNIGLTCHSIATDTTNSRQPAQSRESLQLSALYFDSALVGFRTLHDAVNIGVSYNALSEVNELLGNHKQALAYYKLFRTEQDSVFNETNSKKIAALELERDAELKARKLEAEAAKLEREENIQLAGIGMFIMLLIGLLLILSQKKFSARLINILSTFSLLLVFELTALLLHPHIQNITHHNLMLTLLCLVAMASIIVPLHHKAEHWMKSRLLKGHLPVKHQSISKGDHEK
jgi:tetratricopeptide (TPR) repeat protein